MLRDSFFRREGGDGNRARYVNLLKGLGFLNYFKAFLMNLDAFEVIGGKHLQGNIVPQGAKNEALQVICAVLLTDEKVTLSNVPDILDVRRLITLLKGLGVSIERIKSDTYSFQATEVDLEYTNTDDYRKNARSIRGSVMLMGPLLARFGRAYLPKPGGDKIGRRRLDTHFLGFQSLGAEFKYEENSYFLEARQLKGTYMLINGMKFQ